MNEEKNIIIYVASLPKGTLEQIQALGERHGRQYRTMLLVDSNNRSNTKTLSDYPGLDFLIRCDFNKPNKIAEALLPHQEQLLAITCRGDSNIQYFKKVIPHVPYLRTPTTESLTWATDKYQMRRRLALYDRKNTPKFTKVKDASKKERARVADKIGFPMIIKPANLWQSMLVTICYHEEELEKTLRNVFRRIRKSYESSGRIELPGIIAEEYMDGQMYSIDSYVGARGGVHHCPLVEVKTGRQIGHDDFYNYQQTTPTKLKRATVENAEKVAETAIHALGLRNTTVHTELMKIDDEWKVIELGPRIGGFRPLLHELSCNIDHAANDLLIRMGKKPVIPKKCQGYATAMKWFAEKEGTIVEMKGIKKIEELESFHSIALAKKIGDRAVFARNGGKSIFNLILANEDRSKLLADIRRVEQLVHIKVQTSAQKRAAKNC